MPETRIENIKELTNKTSKVVIELIVRFVDLLLKRPNFDITAPKSIFFQNRRLVDATCELTSYVVEQFSVWEDVDSPIIFARCRRHHLPVRFLSPYSEER